MTALEPKTDRDSKNIDSFERALVYSGLLLFKSVRNPANFSKLTNSFYRDAVTITMNPAQDNNANLSIECSLPYDQVISLDLGGNFIESLKKYGDNDPNPMDIQCPKSDSSFISIVDSQDFVNTLERYFVWAAHTVKANLVKNQPDQSNRITTRFQNKKTRTVDGTEVQDPRLVVTAVVPIDYRKYLRTNNLVCSVRPILNNTVQAYVVGGSTTELMNDDAIMNDDFIMGNANESTVMDDNLIMDNDTILTN